jgi:antitoxin component YwqK of YwqJK toxin-antitoxin module
MKTYSSLFIFIGCMACTHPSSRPEGKKQESKKEVSSYFTFKNTTDSLVQNGEQVLYHKNGKVEMRGMMKNGKRDGVWRSWYESGQPWSETTFKDGVKNGKTTTWYDNGNKRYEGFFKNNKESGRWVFWTENGSISDTKNYDLR